MQTAHATRLFLARVPTRLGSAGLHTEVRLPRKPSGSAARNQSSSPGPGQGQKKSRVGVSAPLRVVAPVPGPYMHGPPLRDGQARASLVSHVERSGTGTEQTLQKCKSWGHAAVCTHHRAAPTCPQRSRHIPTAPSYHPTEPQERGDGHIGTRRAAGHGARTIRRGLPLCSPGGRSPSPERSGGNLALPDVAPRSHEPPPRPAARTAETGSAPSAAGREFAIRRAALPPPPLPRASCCHSEPGLPPPGGRLGKHAPDTPTPPKGPWHSFLSLLDGPLGTRRNSIPSRPPESRIMKRTVRPGKWRE